MRVRDLPGYRPGAEDRDYDLDDLDPDAELSLVDYPTADYQPPDEGWVGALLGVLADPAQWPEDGLPPVVADGPPPFGLVTGRHRLTAAWRLGWRTYPAYLVQG